MSQEIPLKAAIKNSFWLCAVNRNFIWSTELLQQICYWESASSSLMGHPSLQLKLLHGKALGSWNAALAHSFRLIVVTTEESLDASPLAGIEVSVTFHWEIWEIWDWQKYSSLFFASSCWFGRMKSAELVFVKSFSLLPSAVVKVQGQSLTYRPCQAKKKTDVYEPPSWPEETPTCQRILAGKKGRNWKLFFNRVSQKMTALLKVFQTSFFFWNAKSRNFSWNLENWRSIIPINICHQKCVSCWHH